MSSPQVERLKQRLARIPQKVKEAVKPALMEAGDELADQMKQLVPVRTGALRDSIAVTPPGASTPAHSQPGGERKAAENEVIVTAGNTKVRYAHLVEFGTRKAHAHSFFFPAYRMLKAQLQKKIKDSIRKAVKES